MNADDEGPLVDGAAGRLVRPYFLTGGRTEPSVKLDRLTLIWATGKVAPGRVDAEHAEVLLLCREPMAVAEIAAHMRQPNMIIKVLVSDLIDEDAVQSLAQEQQETGSDQDEPSRELLEAVLAGLHRRL